VEEPLAPRWPPLNRNERGRLTATATPEIELPVMPRRLSPSALEKFRACPKAFRLQYLDRAEGKDRPSAVLAVGNAVHHALERFYGLPAQHRNLELLHQALRAVWPEHRKDGCFRDELEEIEYGQQALAMLGRFADEHDLLAAPLAREQWLEARLANGIEVFGKVDRVDRVEGGLKVIDYKTGRRAVTQEALPELPAARVYALAAQERYDQPVVEVSLLYLALGRELTWRPDVGELDRARVALTAEIDDLRATSEFRATPGAQCRFCPFADSCEERTLVRLEDIAVLEEVPF
jgi:putative RecB family exonuclease